MRRFFQGVVEESCSWRKKHLRADDLLWSGVRVARLFVGLWFAMLLAISLFKY